MTQAPLTQASRDALDKAIMRLTAHGDNDTSYLLEVRRTLNKAEKMYAVLKDISENGYIADQKARDIIKSLS